MSEPIQIPSLIKGVEELLSLPDVVVRANELIDSEAAGVEEIAEVIALDPSLTAQLLKLVNSAFYGMPSQIDTISRAITIIGIQELRSLVMSASAVEIFNKVAPQVVDMSDFWFRSVYVGLAAKQLCGERRKAEQMFLMGLMHDVGKIVLFIKADEQANAIMKQALDTGSSVHELEKQRLGFSANQVSAALLANWGLAETLYAPIEQMYAWETDSAQAKDAAILTLATRLSDCAEPELKGKNTEKLSVLEQEAELLAAAEVNADQLEDIMNEVNLYCFDVLSVLSPEASLVF